MSELRDIKNNAVSGVSIKPGVSAGATGAWVDMGLSDGEVSGILSLGDATGTPTTTAMTVKLREADDSSGTGAADITGATATLAAAATANNNTVTIITTGIRSKRYVNMVTTVTHVAGTSPTQPHSAIIVGQKKKL